MTDTKLLTDRITDSGLKLSYIANFIGISQYSLSKKIHNVTEFKTTEVSKLCAVLKITDAEEKAEIFLS